MLTIHFKDHGWVELFLANLHNLSTSSATYFPSSSDAGTVHKNYEMVLDFMLLSWTQGVNIQSSVLHEYKTNVWTNLGCKNFVWKLRGDQLWTFVSVLSWSSLLFSTCIPRSTMMHRVFAAPEAFRADNLVLVKFGFSALSVPRFFGI